MLSTYSENQQRVNDVRQFAVNMLDSKLQQLNPIGEAEYHCQAYTGEGNPPADVMISCTVTITPKGRIGSHFKLNGRRIAAHKVALRLGELGV